MGGEPTLHPNFNLLIQIAQEHFEMVSIFTNAINNKIQTISLREKDGINYNFRFYSYLSSDKLLLDQPGYRALEVLISVDGDIEAIFNNRRNRQTLWGGCTDANPKLLLNDT